MRKKEKKGMPAAICVWIAVAVMIVIAAVITRNKLTWILYLLLIQVLIVIMAIHGMRFAFQKKSSIFAWKIKDRPKHWRTYDFIAKVMITAGLAFLIIYYTLPFMLDVPRLLTGTEERATVVVVSGYDYRKENGAVLPAEVKVRNVEDGTEFSVYLFHGEIDAGECVQMEYLPYSKNARVIQSD